MTRRPLTLLILGAALAGSLLGCQRADDQRTETVDVQTIQEAREQLDPAVLTYLDSANAAFREERFEEARRLYQEAARIDGNAAAAWFGIYMAETAMGNHGAAEEAIRRARSAAPRTSLVEEGIPPEEQQQPAPAGAPAAAPTLPADTGQP